MVAVVSPTALNGTTRMGALAQDRVRSLLREVEAELCDSGIFEQFLTHLEHIPGLTAETAQAQLKEVCREAIRLTARHLLKQVRLQPVSNHPPIHAVPDVASEPKPELAIAPPPPPPLKLDAPAAPAAPTHLGRRLSRGDAQARMKEQREALLQQIGQELHQARMAKGLSINQLYYQTRVPAHQIRALELGAVERLPEDIYIRGFVKRLGDALELDGRQMAMALVPLDPTTVVPSWQQRSPSSSTLPLYVGYTVLMAGAFGGLSWMSNQSMAPDTLPDLTLDAPTVQQGASSSQQQVKVPTGIETIGGPERSSPEAMAF